MLFVKILSESDFKLKKKSVTLSVQDFTKKVVEMLQEAFIFNAENKQENKNSPDLIDNILLDLNNSFQPQKNCCEWRFSYSQFL